MTMITLRPDLKTAGGEVTELLLDGRFVGAMTLVYREGGRLSGSVQLDRESLKGDLKQEAVRAAQNYVEYMVDALGAKDCEVIVTCSPYDHIIAGGHQIGVIESFTEEGESYEESAGEEDDAQLQDVDPDDIDTIEMRPDLSDADIEPFPGEWVVARESRNRLIYHLYDDERDLMAEASVRIRGNDVHADIDWQFEPTDDEIESAVEMLVSDFDPDEIDSFLIEISFAGEIIETMELTHEELFEETDDDELEIDMFGGDERDYSVILVRDDGDTLTYDLYKQSHGGLPIGQATVDISRRELTGFIDFRDPESSADREFIGTLLMRELDKEKDYDSLNLTMLVNNELIDDIWYETEMFH